ncbi:MAG: hypothetical protein J7L78_00430 [Dehalococcoidales bacterium]|nr:hypothetical protein [Dehalococcoidales bacterium]
MVGIIECLVCEKPIKIPSCINLNDYDGQLYCHECNLLWNIRWKSSKVIKYKLAAKQTIKVEQKVEITPAFPERKYPENTQGDVKES